MKIENTELIVKATLFEEGLVEQVINIIKKNPRLLRRNHCMLNYYDFTCPVSFEDNIVVVMLNEKFYIYKN